MLNQWSGTGSAVQLEMQLDTAVFPDSYNRINGRVGAMAELDSGSAGRNFPEFSHWGCAPGTAFDPNACMGRC